MICLRIRKSPFIACSLSKELRLTATINMATPSLRCLQNFGCKLLGNKSVLGQIPSVQGNTVTAKACESHLITVYNVKYVNRFNESIFKLTCENSLNYFIIFYLYHIILLYKLYIYDIIIYMILFYCYCLESIFLLL